MNEDNNEDKSVNNKCLFNKKKVLIQLSTVSLVALIMSCYLTKSFIYGYLIYSLIAIGLWSIVYVENFWNELSNKIKVVMVSSSIISIFFGLSFIFLRIYTVKF